jgi:hypothetical protein
MLSSPSRRRAGRWRPGRWTTAAGTAARWAAAAASPIASASVGCGWMVRARSSARQALRALRRGDDQRVRRQFPNGRSGPHAHAEPAERALDLADQLGVEAAEHVVQRLHDGHLGAELGQRGAQLDADVAAADHRHRGGDLLQVERAGGVEHPVAVGRQLRQRDRPRPGRQDGVVEAEVADLVGRLDRTRCGSSRRAVPWTTSTFERSRRTPSASPPTTERFQACTAGRSRTRLAPMPRSPSAAIRARSRAAVISALLGMQPALRQTPPSRSRSTSTTSLPSSAARAAVV